MLCRGILTTEDTIRQSIPLKLIGKIHSLLNVKMQESVSTFSSTWEMPFDF